MIPTIYFLLIGSHHFRLFILYFFYLLNLTPSKKKLMEQLRKTKCTYLDIAKKRTNFIEKIESTVLKDVVTSAVKNQKRKPKGRQWTTTNKISASAIFKRSWKTLRYLQHLIPLSSVKTIQNVSKKNSMEPALIKPSKNS